MDDLLQKYNDYIRLKNCRAEYLLSNGMIIDFTYSGGATYTLFVTVSINTFFPSNAKP